MKLITWIWTTHCCSLSLIMLITEITIKMWLTSIIFIWELIIDHNHHYRQFLSFWWTIIIFNDLKTIRHNAQYQNPTILKQEKIKISLHNILFIFMACWEYLKIKFATNLFLWMKVFCLLSCRVIVHKGSFKVFCACERRSILSLKDWTKNNCHFLRQLA